MAKLTLNLGTAPNDRTGDTLRDAGTKVNSNFSELYTALGNGTALNIASSGATSGQVLKFNGTSFVPASDLNNDAVTSVNALTGAVVLVTDNIAEDGSPVNLWFTNARARSAVSASSGVAYNSSTGVITLSATSDNLTEGTTNLFYTSSRFNSSFGQKTTNDLAEGNVNKYFTNTLARGAISGTGDISYDTGTGVISLTSPVTLTNTVTLTNKTLTSPVLGGTTISASGNIVVKPATNILEVQGDGSSVVGQLQLNCHVNSHGQKIASQPHSVAATNTLLLPGGTTIGNANAVLVSDTGIQTLTNKTLTSPVLGGTTISASGNIVVKPATNILEVQGDGTSVVGKLQLNCHVNSHGQKIASQPHSEAATNTLLLPGGNTIGNANAVLVSDTGIQTLTNKTAGVATATSTAASLGYLGIPQNSQAANYTTVIGDAGKHIYVTATSTVTIPANGTVAYPIGTTIGFIADTGVTVTIAITTDTMYLAGTGTTGSRTLAAFGMATAVKVTATSWFISGYGLT